MRRAADESERCKDVRACKQLMLGKSRSNVMIKRRGLIIKREGSVDGKMRDGMGSRGGCRAGLNESKT
jgi:hypothetical protein